MKKYHASTNPIGHFPDIFLSKLLKNYTKNENYGTIPSFSTKVSNRPSGGRISTSTSSKCMSNMSISKEIPQNVRYTPFALATMSRRALTP
jgi:hypothetical protein